MLLNSISMESRSLPLRTNNSIVHVVMFWMKMTRDLYWSSKIVYFEESHLITYLVAVVVGLHQEVMF